MRYRTCSAVVLLAFCTTPCVAQPTTEPPDTAAAMEDLRKSVANLNTQVGEIAEQLKQLQAASEQQGLDILQRFGVGLALASDIDNGPRIVSASVDPNGFVRISADRNVRAGVILEFHSLMFCEKLDFDDPDYPQADAPINSAASGSPQADDAAPGERRDVAQGDQHDAAQGAQSDGSRSRPIRQRARTDDTTVRRGIVLWNEIRTTRRKRSI